MVDEIGSAIIWGLFHLLFESKLGWLITIPLLACALYLMFYVYFTLGLVFTAIAVGLMIIQIKGTVKRSKSRKESSIND